jgi:surface protein
MNIKNKAQGTIEEPFRKTCTQKSIAQGTIEYLVILAVVVVIGLVVVSLLTNQTNTQTINSTTDKIDSQTRSGITVTEGYTDSLNENLLVIRNNDPKPLTLKTISDGTNTKAYNTNIPATSETTIKLNEIDELNCICETGQTTKTCEYTITYESKNGIEYTSTQTTNVECLEEINANNNAIEPEPLFYEQNGTIYCPYAEVSDTGIVNEIEYTKRTKEQITTENATTTCTSGIINMSGLFQDESDFNENISHWDTTNVQDMSYMFYNSPFNQNISNWNTENVTNMESMFSISPFNQDISNWNTENVQYMGYMFSWSQFNQNISNWNTTNVQEMSGMFSRSQFNQDISNWNTTNVQNMSNMFYNSPFNQPINDWNTTNVQNMSYMFSISPFNQNISNWNTENVTNMESMFSNADSFNQNLSGWCVTNIPSKPTDFDTGATSWTGGAATRPQWGTCP